MWRGYEIDYNGCVINILSVVNQGCMKLRHVMLQLGYVLSINKELIVHEI